MNADPLLRDNKVLSLADFTSEVLILPELKARTMPGAILELSQAFPRSDGRWDAEKLNHAALEREQQMSTAMEFGAAFPHARSNDWVRLQFALGRSAVPFVWSRGQPRVQFVFLNAVPANDAMGVLEARFRHGPAGQRCCHSRTIQDCRLNQRPLELLSLMPVRR